MSNIPESIENLTSYFSQLPGIGQRQATRIAFSLVSKKTDFLKDFSSILSSLKSNLTRCQNCRRIVEKSEVDKDNLCRICSDTKRDQNIIAVVKNEIDLDVLEETGEYNGVYFVLGSLIKRRPTELEAKKVALLIDKIKKMSSKKPVEIIIALDTTPSGKLTSMYIASRLNPLKIKITRLGQGLPTGSEMEYADKETLKNSLLGRR